jgi:hypothetical protein
MIHDLEELMPDATAEELYSGIEMAVTMTPEMRQKLTLKPGGRRDDIRTSHHRHQQNWRPGRYAFRD